MAVADEAGAVPFRSLRQGKAGELEIVDAHPVTTGPVVAAPFAGADHDPLPVAHLAAEVDHHMGHRRVALDVVGAGPEKKIARLEVVEFERLVAGADDRLEVALLPDPGIKLVGLARDVFHADVIEQVEDRARAVHAAVLRIGRAVGVFETLLRERERILEQRLHLGRIGVEVLELRRLERGGFAVGLGRRRLGGKEGGKSEPQKRDQKSSRQKAHVGKLAPARRGSARSKIKTKRSDATLQ